MKVTDIELGRIYAIDRNRLVRTVRALLKGDRDGLDRQQIRRLDRFASSGKYGGFIFDDRAYPGKVLAVGVPCGKLTDGVKIAVCHNREYDEADTAEITVHAPAVTKLWDEHEMSEDVSLRDAELRRADWHEEQARKIRAEWGWP